MQTRQGFYKTALISLTLLLGLGNSAFATSTIPEPTTSPTPLSAEEFIGPQWMESALHRVSPNTHNNGRINRYTIETHHGTFAIDGTYQARMFIHEITAAEDLTTRSTAGALGQAVQERVVNFVKTPIDVIGSIGDRIDTVSSVEDAILLAPRTTMDVGEQLINGVGEAAYTGKRLLKKVGDGSSCQGAADCIAEVNEQAIKGLNSLTGKNRAARKIHAEFGTDSETQNPILQREVDRLSFTQSYAKTGIKLFLPDKGISGLDEYLSAVRFYNNGETIAFYEDRLRYREDQKERLEDRGLSRELIRTFYKNPSFTNRERINLVDSLERFGDTANIEPILQRASIVTTRYDAAAFEHRYRYLAAVFATNNFQAFNDASIMTTLDGRQIQTIMADYLDWTDQNSDRIAPLVNAEKAEIHILGQASPGFKRNANQQGIMVVEIW